MNWLHYDWSPNYYNFIAVNILLTKKETCLPFSGELSKWSSDQERDRSWFEGRLWWPQQSDWNPATSVEDDQCHTTKVYSWILNISHGICDCVYAFVMVWWGCVLYICDCVFGTFVYLVFGILHMMLTIVMPSVHFHPFAGNLFEKRGLSIARLVE